MATCLLGVKQLTITTLNVRHIWLLPFFTSVPFQSGFYGLLLQFYFPLFQYGRTHLSREHILLGNTLLLLPSGYCTRAQMTTYPVKEGLRRACTLGRVCLSRKMLLFLWKGRRGVGDKPGFSGFPVIIFQAEAIIFLFRLCPCQYSWRNGWPCSQLPKYKPAVIWTTPHFLQVFIAQNCLDTDLMLLFRYQQCIWWRSYSPSGSSVCPSLLPLSP